MRRIVCDTGPLLHLGEAGVRVCCHSPVKSTSQRPLIWKCKATKQRGVSTSLPGCA